MPTPPRRPNIAVPIGPNVIAPPRVAVPVRGAPPRAPSPAAIAPRARLDALVAELAAMKQQMTSMVYRTGAILAELRTPPMLAAADCASFEELLTKYDLTGRLTAMKYIAVAENFTEPVALQLGVDKGYALVRYSAALSTSKPGVRTQLPQDLIARNVRIAGVSVADIKPAAIFDAIKQLRERERGAAETDTAADADRAVRKLGAKLRRAGAPGAKLRRVRRGGAYRVVVELDADEALELAGRL